MGRTMYARRRFRERWICVVLCCVCTIESNVIAVYYANICSLICMNNNKTVRELRCLIRMNAKLTWKRQSVENLLKFIQLRTHIIWSNRIEFHFIFFFCKFVGHFNVIARYHRLHASVRTCNSVVCSMFAILFAIFFFFSCDHTPCRMGFKKLFRFMMRINK